MEVVNRHRLAGREYLGKKDFFEAVSTNAGYLPTEIVEKVYWALIRTTVKELRRTGLVRFPDFGDFTLRMMRARRVFAVDRSGKQRMQAIGERRILRFDSDYKLKGYFRLLDGGSPALSGTTGKPIRWEIPR